VLFYLASENQSGFDSAYDGAEYKEPWVSYSFIMGKTGKIKNEKIAFFRAGFSGFLGCEIT